MSDDNIVKSKETSKKRSKNKDKSDSSFLMIILSILAISGFFVFSYPMVTIYSILTVFSFIYIKKTKSYMRYFYIFLLAYSMTSLIGKLFY